MPLHPVILSAVEASLSLYYGALFKEIPERMAIGRPGLLMITIGANPRLEGMPDYGGKIADEPHPARYNNQCNMEGMIDPGPVEKLLGFATLAYETLLFRVHIIRLGGSIQVADKGFVRH